MLIELFRSWCFECPEVELEHSAQVEAVVVHSFSSIPYSYPLF